MFVLAAGLIVVALYGLSHVGVLGALVFGLPGVVVLITAVRRMGSHGQLAAGTDHDGERRDPVGDEPAGDEPAGDEPAGDEPVEDRDDPGSDDGPRAR